MRRLGVVAVATMLTCRGAAPTRVSSNGVEVRRVSGDERVAARSARAARVGDWVLRDRALQLTVVGVEAPARDERPGTVAQILYSEAPGAEVVRTIAPVLRVGQREINLADVTLSTVTGATPMLRVSGRARTSQGPLDVVRDYALETGRQALHVYTRVTNPANQRVERVAWGVRITWGGASPFAPGFGFVTDERQGEGAWVGATAGGVAAAWALGSAGRPFSLQFSAEMHGANANAGHTDVLVAPATLLPGQTVIDHAVLLFAEGDLTEVARAVAFARDLHVAEAAVSLGGNAQDPEVIVSDAAGRPVLAAHPRGRDVTFPLAPGDYVATATAPGHAPADPARFTVTRDMAGAVPVVLEIPRGGHIRVEARDDDTGRDLPVRVTVRGVAPTRDPNLGSADRAAGAGPIAIALQGRTEVPVPPGRYRVTVSHGPEWTLDEHEVTVTATLRAEVRASLQHVVPMAAWVGCDLHVHANPSFDSRVTIEDRVASLVAEGVGFATPTEHNVVGDYSAGVAMLSGAIDETLQWVPAVEVTTDRSAQPWGHFNVYPYRPDPNVPGGAPPPFLNTTPRQIFRAARANNPDAIIQVNHPRMQPNIGYFNTTGLDVRTQRAVSPEYDPGFDAIEVFNGHYINRLDQVENVLRDWMSLLASGRRYVATGSSDSHRVLYQWAGYPRTYVHVTESARAPTDILAALRRGRAFVTSGPMLFLTAGEAEPGDTVPVARQSPVRLRVRVLAAPWIPVDAVDLYRDGQRAATLTVRSSREATRLDAETTLAISPGSFVVAVARGPRGGLNAALPYSEGIPFAFTNPIFFGPAAGATRRGR
jgi:hypothetical protein